MVKRGPYILGKQQPGEINNHMTGRHRQPYGEDSRMTAAFLLGSSQTVRVYTGGIRKLIILTFHLQLVVPTPLTKPNWRSEGKE